MGAVWKLPTSQLSTLLSNLEAPGTCSHLSRCTCTPLMCSRTRAVLILIGVQAQVQVSPKSISMLKVAAKSNCSCTLSGLLSRLSFSGPPGRSATLSLLDRHGS